MGTIGRIYHQAFERSPAGTLAITNGVLAGIGDAVAQATEMVATYREAQNQPNAKPRMALPQHVQTPAYDPARTLRFVTFGTIFGPILARWNYFLEHRFPLWPSSPSSKGNVSLTALARRVGVDQLVMAPLGLALFLGAMGAMEGRSLPGTHQKFTDLYSPAIKANWSVWPLIQLVNFRFMPLPHRVPFQATCGVFWTLYISLLNSGGATKIKQAHGDLELAGEKMKRAAAKS